MIRPLVPAAAAAGIILLAGCGGGSSSSSSGSSGAAAAPTAAATMTSSATTSSASTGAASIASLATAKNKLGTILVDSKGRTLYMWDADKGTTSTCYGACAKAWPPLLTTAKPVSGTGVTASLIGTTKRTDGKLEVTYGGHPLYYFVADAAPGQVTGQGSKGFGAAWWVLAPSGKVISAPTAAVGGY